MMEGPPMPPKNKKGGGHEGPIKPSNPGGQHPPWVCLLFCMISKYVWDELSNDIKPILLHALVHIDQQMHTLWFDMVPHTALTPNYPCHHHYPHENKHFVFSYCFQCPVLLLKQGNYLSALLFRFLIGSLQELIHNSKLRFPMPWP